jgi:hypothetical protein
MGEKMSHMTTITKSPTLEELRQAAAKLQADLAAAEKAEREKAAEAAERERVARAIAASEQQALNFNLYAGHLAAALEQAGLNGAYDKAGVNLETGELRLPKFQLAYPAGPRFEQRYSGGSSWRMTRAGYHVAVGAHGQGVRIFPALAKGGYNYDKIAKAVADCVLQTERQRQNVAAADRLDTEAKAVAAQLGGSATSWEYAGGGRSRRGAPKVVLTLAQAKALLERLK